MQISTRDIRLGPSHMEKCLSARLGDKLNKDEKLIEFKRIIEEIEVDCPIKHGHRFRVKSFCLGYLYHQAARLTEDAGTKRRFRECALNHYQYFIRKEDNGEEQFFAYFSVGVLLQTLDQPWLESEQKFLTAYELNPGRGEPIDRIIQHYLSIQQWPIAFLFSNSAKDQFYGKLPGQGKWGIEKSFYNWRVLHLHIAACFSLGRMKEATETFAYLYGLTLKQTEIFLPEEVNLIRGQKNLFPEFEIYVKNSA